ncbi:proline--tRNA ligase, partial [Candidatus Woesearchaeota archaeon]|nr:proline--tRNA ligase [Candidatus Woesearchaeota archaeon]
MAEEKDIGITVKKSENISEWYTQVIRKADLIEYTSVSGCLVFRPWSYAIWEEVKKFFDNHIKKRGIKNAYFPLLIPESLLKKESEHVEGFSPEVAWVNYAGNTKLNEKLAIRPTSETIMYEAYSKWIRSYRDLPLLLNQWCNVVRWEFANPVPFLRTREFLWQEGHTVHATQKGAEDEVYDILDLYKKVFEEMYAIPVLKGVKSEKEKFAGALFTTSVEAFLPSGKAIQGATSHCLGQNFSKVFDIKFIDEDEKIKYGWQNSWGISTRTIGIMIMIHGDDKGLVLPPKVAPLQAVIVPIYFKEKGRVMESAEKIKKSLEGDFRIHLDNREEYTPGWKFNEWEMKGVPVRIEIGPKDIEKSQVILVRRDTGEKIPVLIKDLNKTLSDILQLIHDNLYSKAKKSLEDNIV